MPLSKSWIQSDREIETLLSVAHSRRLEIGKLRTQQIKLRVEASRQAGREREAEMQSQQLDRNSIRRTMRLRREWKKLETDGRRVGAAIRRSERARKAAEQSVPGCTKALPRARPRAAKDLYFEWISRGFSSERERNYRSGGGKPRIAARKAAWRDHEFGDKIAYIEREDALEEVAGAVISNMGETLEERMGCAERIEELEQLSRSDAGVYTHVILPMPHELSPEGRVRAMRDLAAGLDGLGLPYTMALHKPDPDHDGRNFHLHATVSLRPMKRSEGTWAFEAAKQTWLSTPPGLRLQRRVIAATFNRALAAEGLAARYTARSRAADGLEPGCFTKRAGVTFDRSAVSAGVVDDLTVAKARLVDLDALGASLDQTLRGLDLLERFERAMDAHRARAAEIGVIANPQPSGSERDAGTRPDAPSPHAMPKDKVWEKERDPALANSQPVETEDEVNRPSPPPMPQAEPELPPLHDLEPTRHDRRPSKPRPDKKVTLVERREAIARDVVERFHTLPGYAALTVADRHLHDSIVGDLVRLVSVGDLHVEQAPASGKQKAVHRAYVRTDRALALAREANDHQLIRRLLYSLTHDLASLPPPPGLSPGIVIERPAIARARSNSRGPSRGGIGD